jgi:hypothetical protein
VVYWGKARQARKSDNLTAICEPIVPCTDRIRGWVGLRDGLDDMKKLQFFYPTGTRTPIPRSSSSVLNYGPLREDVREGGVHVHLPYIFNLETRLR